MQDMGPIEYAKTEPVFHAPWEARLNAMSSAVGSTGKEIARIPPEESRRSPQQSWLYRRRVGASGS
jgi:hypothetical protein